MMTLLIAVFAATLSIFGQVEGKTLFCYWGSWSTYRWGQGELRPNQINPQTCTHLVYAFAGLDQNFKIQALDPWNDVSQFEGGGKDNYRNLVALKRQNPNLKVLLGLGGWNEGSIKFSQMASSPVSRSAFVDSVDIFLNRFGFDGLDFAWQWPAQRGGILQDKQNFVLVLQQLFQKFKPKNLILSIAAPGIYDANGYDLPNIMPYVDYLSIYAYDYQSNGMTLEHGSPLYNPQITQHSVSKVVEDYLNNGAQAKKLLLGVTLYGRSYKLYDANRNQIGDPSNGQGDPGAFTQTRGLLAWFEHCSKGYTTRNDETQRATYSFNSYEWIAHESKYSLQEKVLYAKNKNLAGITLWSLDNDDNHNICGASLASFVANAL